MPAVRKPTAVLESVGAFKANPNRSRPDEPDTGRGIGPAPDHMDEDAASIWDEVVGSTAPGVFQSSDRPMMEMLANLLAEYRRDVSGFGGRKYMTLLNLLARSGMTPSDRSRVTVKSGPQPKEGLAKFR